MAVSAAVKWSIVSYKKSRFLRLSVWSWVDR
jgi:hypothetical protein